MLIPDKIICIPVKTYIPAKGISATDTAVHSIDKTIIIAKILWVNYLLFITKLYGIRYISLILILIPVCNIP